MLKQQGLGDIGGLGQLTSGRAVKPVFGKQLPDGLHNRRPPLGARQSAGRFGLLAVLRSRFDRRFHALLVSLRR
jgi:hypothetical protein